MKTKSDELYEKLHHGRPAFLFLGQRYLSLETGRDPLLAEIIRKYGDGVNEPENYWQMLGSSAYESPESALAWMQERCNRFPKPEWLEIVASFPWSGVYTSAIDSIWQSAFRMSWRDLQPLYDVDLNPLDARNRHHLHCTFLYGCVNQNEPRKQPPLEEENLDIRQAIATSLSLRLPELITPLGILVIEGYAGDADWFQPEKFAAILNSLNIEQVHLFSATENLRQNRRLSRFAQKGKIVFHTESLSTYLIQASEAGKLVLGEPPEQEEYGRQIRLESKSLTVPLELWNQVSRTAIILDDTVVAEPSNISENRLYTEFRRFLAESSIKPIWTGYYRGFAFQRDFHKNLYDFTIKKLASNELQEEPILLYGSPGTGKSIALGWLAYQVRQNQHYPVLFIAHKSRAPLYSDLEAFCSWVEDSGASSTLIVWDGIVDQPQYYELAKWLAGRGRKAILVGSIYQQQSENQITNSSVEAPAVLSKAAPEGSISEKDRFIKYLERFAPQSEQILRSSHFLDSDRFLVALYRLLPPTRGQIQESLTREVRFVEQDLTANYSQSSPKTSFAVALLQAGFIQKEQLIDLETEDIAGETVTQLQKLVRLVMVPGRFGLNIPLEILARVLSGNNITDLIGLIKQLKTDIICWYEDEIGDIELGPRHRLEAEQIVRSLLGSAESEVEYAKELFLKIRERSSGRSEPELLFALNLIRSMGPNGLDPHYFTPQYEKLADVLEQMRTQQGIQNTSLMLQEATLLRESVIQATRRLREHPEQDLPQLIKCEALLNKAERVLKEALDSLESDVFNKQRRNRLLVELSAVLGTKFKHFLEDRNNPTIAKECLSNSHQMAFEAFKLDPENYYPIDILSWTSITALDKMASDPTLKIEVEANIYHAFTLASLENFPPKQQTDFQKRRRQVAELTGKVELSESAMQELLKLDPAAAYHLEGYEKVHDFLFEDQLSQAQIQECYIVLDQLKEHYDVLKKNAKALYFLLRIWWLSKTGRRLFYDERQTLPFSTKDWRYLSELLKDLMLTNEFYENSSLTYLQGIAEFHLNHIATSLEVFKQLEVSETGTGRRRIIRSYLASDTAGKPKLYSGTVDWRRGNPRDPGLIYVAELQRQKIKFVPQQFGRPDIRPGEVINEFYIAFNFLGPIADPVGYYKQYTERKLKPVHKR
ncbi:hypothetical protein IQ265_06060 [Nodosilinea sp. LEGE 06152]|uniref:hypothetical protein n=1 Tax=Nodosilinea sp. LEGE 06152 TaxID=2777966 RepID=UPI0018821725|nr:hypothetical protein [Nodosilinea sp. LEGE 06152]MBE9156393.1 hypothetical protein [Nodosilinea sp. LEGE 06152]